VCESGVDTHDCVLDEDVGDLRFEVKEIGSRTMDVYFETIK
jgi:hypothetical protein